MRLRRIYKTSLVLRALNVAALLACVLAVISAQEKPRTPLPFERGEELVYQVEFTRGLLRGVDVAEFHFKSIPEQVARGADDAGHRAVMVPLPFRIMSAGGAGAGR